LSYYGPFRTLQGLHDFAQQAGCLPKVTNMCHVWKYQLYIYL